MAVNKPELTYSKIKFDDIKNVFPNKDVIVINKTIYDVTSFKDVHPGGKETLEEYLYNDATEAFTDIGHSDLAKQHLTQFFVGIIDDTEFTEDNVKLKDVESTDNVELKDMTSTIRKINPNISESDSDDIDPILALNSCSGLSRDCERIRQDVMSIFSCALGLVSFAISFLVTRDCTISFTTTFCIVFAFFVYYATD